ncbi:MAG: HD domain-containing protein, partial [Paraglaciecola sp.]|nr:HD domain-containing protein [Paraglaciecola sp.]
MLENFSAITQFIVELEKLKNVSRRIKPVGLTRYENSAEHSWQIALLALTLLPYAEQALDQQKVLTMLLLHDVVEIDTGDKFAYDANHDDFVNELLAAKRLFALLPNDTGQQFLALWEEFEQAQSPEAQFAKGIDRLMPLIQNLHNGCQSWLEHDISVQQIFKKNAAIAYTHPLLWDWIQQQITDKAK